MQALVNRAILVLAVTAGCLGSAQAQEWLLNSGASRFYMQTVKANSIFEVHQFSGLDGSISNSGDANVKIDLTSVASGVDVRDVRMRFLLFETYKFPNAEVTAKLDMASLQALRTTTRISYPLKFKLALHGFSREIETPVTVTRLSDKSISVATAKPIVITADTFGFGPASPSSRKLSTEQSLRPGRPLPSISCSRPETSSPSFKQPALKPSSARRKKRPARFRRKPARPGSA